MLPKLELADDNGWHWKESQFLVWIGNQSSHICVGHHLGGWSLGVTIGIWHEIQNYSIGFLCFYFSVQWRGL